MKVESFGTLSNGNQCDLITIENDFLKIAISNYGATLVSLIVKDLELDVVKGFDDVKHYENDGAYLGATVGRVCNRIGRGKFSLNNHIYDLYINNNTNSLHGGKLGFSYRIFDYDIFEDSIVLSYISQDMEEGYPGRLELKVTYRLVDKKLYFETEAIAYEDTICSITNHSYFNLEGIQSDSALNLLLKINSHQIGCLDRNGLTLEEVLDVKDTPFDFNEFKTIIKDIDNDHLQLHNGFGYDHNYILGDLSLKEACILKSNQLEMKIFTTLPCMHFYSANFLTDKPKGKNGSPMTYRSGLCFECQYYPNAINYSSQIKPIVKKNEIQKHQTIYQFDY